jgi:quinol monooxygenase YgiN
MLLEFMPFNNLFFKFWREMMVTINLRIKVSNKQRKDFINSAKLILGPTRIQAGCISCRLYQDLDEPDAIFLVEEWESREKLERYFSSEQCWIILSLLEASDQLPEFKINTVSKMEGLEAIEAARRGQEISYA